MFLIIEWDEDGPEGKSQVTECEDITDVKSTLESITNEIGIEQVQENIVVYEVTKQYNLNEIEKM